MCRDTKCSSARACSEKAAWERVLPSSLPPVHSSFVTLLKKITQKKIWPLFSKLCVSCQLIFSSPAADPKETHPQLPSPLTLTLTLSLSSWQTPVSLEVSLLWRRAALCIPLLRPCQNSSPPAFPGHSLSSAMFAREPFRLRQFGQNQCGLREKKNPHTRAQSQVRAEEWHHLLEVNKNSMFALKYL